MTISDNYFGIFFYLIVKWWGFNLEVHQAFYVLFYPIVYIIPIYHFWKNFEQGKFPTVLLKYILFQILKLWVFIVNFYLTFNVGFSEKVHGLSIYRVFNEVSESNFSDNCVRVLKFSYCSVIIVHP